MLKIRSKAPLRLGLCGGGTDIEAYSARYGGLVLNSTISLYVHCTILERADSHIYFEIADTKESLLLPSSSHLGHIGGGQEISLRSISRFTTNFVRCLPCHRLALVSTLILMCLVVAGLGGAPRSWWRYSKPFVNGSISR